jgi:hypothetical protein
MRDHLLIVLALIAGIKTATGVSRRWTALNGGDAEDLGIRLARASTCPEVSA